MSINTSAMKFEAIEKISKMLMDFLECIPETHELPSSTPHKRAKEIAQSAAIKAASTSGTLALPPGPFGLLTILPDLLAVWKIQSQMVVDIAGTYGKKAEISKEAMLYCLFKHTASQAFRDVIIRVGERYLVKKQTTKIIQFLLQKIGLKVSQRIAGKGISRLLPIIGAAGVAAYAFYDTNGVGKTAIEFFSKEIDRE